MASQYSAPSYQLLQTFADTVEDWPGHRCGHTLTAVFANNSHQLILFGGSTSAVRRDDSSLPEINLEYVTNLVHLFDVSTRRWKRVYPSGEAPSPRAGHAAVSFGSFVLIQGGIGPFGPSNGDVYMLDMTRKDQFKWRRWVVHSEAPGPRYGHVMGIASKRWLIIFGGTNGDEFLPGTWALDTLNPVAWERVHPYGNQPCMRMLASASVREDGLFFLCSGRDPSGVIMRDTYVLDMDRNGQWFWILVPGVPPSPRYSHTAVIEGSRMHVIGGVLNRARLIDGEAVVAVLETQTGEWLNTNGQETYSRNGQNHNQLIMRRFGHAAASVGSRIYVHGGLKEDVMLDDFLMAETSQPPSPEPEENPEIYALLDNLLVVDTSEPSSSSQSSMETMGDAYNLPSLEAAFYGCEPEGHAPLQHRADQSQDESRQTNSFVPQFTRQTISFVPQLTGQTSTDQELHKKVISTLLRPRNWEPPAKREFFLSSLEVERLCCTAEQIFVQEPTILQLKVPIKIFGDLHGQFGDLMRLFREYGSPSMEGDITHIDYLFLGDYVDRGQHSLEIILLLLALKIEYPKNVHLIRGNHESLPVNSVHGFFAECKERLGASNGLQAWRRINTLFDHLPLAALIENRIFCMHGGVGRTVSIDEIASLQRPCNPDNDNNMVLKDLLWSDPTANDSIMGIQHNPRGGDTIAFGPDIVKAFCERNKVKLIIRAHECVRDGFERFAQGQLITVFSATNYCGIAKNAGAILVVGRDRVIYPKLIHPEPPSISSSENSPDNAWMQELNSERPPTPPRGEETVYKGRDSVSSSCG